MSSKGRRCWRRRGSTSASSRSACSAAARPSGHRARPHHPRRPARDGRPRRDLLLLPDARDARIRRRLPPPADLDYEMWTGPAPMRPYNSLVHPRSWRAFMEYSNGIVGDMCVHMLDMVRWMLDLGMPTRMSSSGGILVDKESKANITDTQTATFEYPNLRVVWTHRRWGDPPDPKYPWGATILRRPGHAQSERDGLRLRADRQGRHARTRGRAVRVRPVPRGSHGEGARNARGPRDSRRT